MPKVTQEVSGESLRSLWSVYCLWGFSIQAPHRAGLQRNRKAPIWSTFVSWGCSLLYCTPPGGALYCTPWSALALYCLVKPVFWMDAAWCFQIAFLQTGGRPSSTPSGQADGDWQTSVLKAAGHFTFSMISTSEACGDNAFERRAERRH